MTVYTTIGPITASSETLNQISFYLSDCPGAVTKAAGDEIYLSLKLSGFYDKNKEDV